MTESTQNLTFDEAIKAIFDGKIVEVKRCDLSTHPVWVPISGVTTINQLNQLKNNRFRQVTPTINIGGHSVPKPMTEPPKNETLCYMPEPINKDLYAWIWWRSDEFYNECLKRGLVHSTKEAAIAHAKALIAISGGEV